MRRRVLLAGLLGLVMASLATACTPAAPTATLTPHAKPSTRAPTLGPSPTATLVPSPTQPPKPQTVREVTLRALPGVGHAPQAIAISDGRVYVANRTTQNVSVIEGDKVRDVIEVGDAPVAIAADERTGLVYVANEGDDSISVISGSRVVRTVSAPHNPACLAALDGRLYAGGRGDSTLAVLDGLSGVQIATVPLRAQIGVLALAVNPASDLLYASVYDGVEIVHLEDLSIVGRLQREIYVTLGADPVSGRLLVGEYDAESGDHYLVAYDALGQRELGRVPIGGDPRGIAVDGDSGRIYVANSWTNDVSVIDAQDLQPVATIPVGLRPLDVAVGKEGVVYVANSGSDNVARIDRESNRMLGAVPLALLPAGMAVDAETGTVYVASPSTNSVFVLRGEQVVTEIPAGLHPSELALSPDGETLFVLNLVGGDLMSIATRNKDLVRTADIGRLPRGLAVVPEAGQLYASDAVLDVDSQQLLRRTQLLTIYRSEVKPTHIQVDPRAGRAYMVASNGVPGSNSGLMVYVIDVRTGEPIEGQVGGLSMSGLALDPPGGRIFSTAGRFGRYELIVNDASTLEREAALDMPRYPAAIAYNPVTHHLFIYLTYRAADAEPGSEMLVLDGRGLGTVARFEMPGQRTTGEEYHLSVDARRGYVYLSDAQRGTVHILRDAALPAPPSPTPTDTPTPWPTLTPQLQPGPTATEAQEPTCAQLPGPRLEPYWSRDRTLRLGLGCTTHDMLSVFMAEQPFERGYMMWREPDRTVFVLFNDGVWRSFADRWQEGMPDYGCEATPPGNMLQPKRGFGLVWCVEEGVKEGLGWALDEEQGYTNEWQAFEGGEMIVSGARLVVYALFADGTFLEYPVR
ncbi:MAG: hypothetical protein AMJ93_07230 [Anaerolineae bacterium SM23_84]|nr:MAG: hypothetical protein AMJ93_07230 [Anaerolineae bacterium SM23_84]